MTTNTRVTINDNIKNLVSLNINKLINKINKKCVKYELMECDFKSKILDIPKYLDDLQNYVNSEPKNCYCEETRDIYKFLHKILDELKIIGNSNMSKRLRSYVILIRSLVENTNNKPMMYQDFCKL